ncbi:MAG: site-specific DNA-methyltransferase, partial [Acidobacteriota bacterium]
VFASPKHATRALVAAAADIQKRFGTTLAHTSLPLRAVLGYSAFTGDRRWLRMMVGTMSLVRQPSLKWDETQFDPAPFMKDGASEPFYVSALGALYSDDCMAVLPFLKDGTVDTVFADPPFNLGKEYGSRSHDELPDDEYLSWCKGWIRECCRTLKPGGAFFLYNLPKWNILLGGYMTELGMMFRHWIAIEISACLPIPGRLHPSHYSLLYYSKGKPKTFRRIRTPILTCRHCGGEVKDYGGHRDAMNPDGVNLKDVWTDIPPVRHWKFKSKDRRANALSTKILDRVVELSTVPGEIVLDPFGGSGTTFAVCEKKSRRWLGVEIDFAREIVERLESGEIHSHKNGDFVEG